MIHNQGGWMVLKNFDEYTLDIYDITDLENPILRNSLPMDSYGYPWTFCFIDESDPNSFYLCNNLTDIFWKFDISESGEPVQLFEYDLPLPPESIAVINSIAYATVGSSPYNLLVIDGLNENDPFIANDINNFTENKYINGQDGYLTTIAQYASSSTAQIFQLDDPLQPELYFTPQWGERIEIEDDLIFVKTNHIIGVYENRSNCTEPIAIFNGLNYIYNINLIEHEGTDYLITNEMANIGLFEYSYIPSSVEEELLKPEFTLSNYPNPFNPETTISFQLNTENTGHTEINIYNIKGQKVKTFIVTLSGDEGLNNNYISNPSPSTPLRMTQAGSKHYSVVWNGTDSNNKPVSSGIYMYQLKVDGKAIAGKKCLLLK